jgi:hypothetical protein
MNGILSLLSDGWSSHILTLWTQVNSGFPKSLHPPTVCGKCMWCVNKRNRIRKGNQKERQTTHLHKWQKVSKDLHRKLTIYQHISH